jgi:4-amino-4-deoxy-L-arabinose transferase-like glycosyltransferase
VFPQLELHATAFRPPLYPITLSLPTWLFGEDVLWPARLLSLLLGLAVIALTVVFVRRVGGPLAALAAGLAVALYPPLIANDTVTLTEPLALVLLLGVLITLDRRQAVWCGLLSGLLMLTRPNAYLVVLIAAVALWRSVGVKRALTLVGVSVLVLVPWMVRNQVQVGTPRLTTSEGFNLTAIYSPEAQQTEGFVDPVFDDRFAGTEVRLAQFDEATWNDVLTSFGLSGLREQPTYLFEVVGRNLQAYLELSPTANESPEGLDGRNLDVRRWTLPLFYLVTIAGLAGLWVHRRDRAMWPAVAIVAQFAVLSLLLVAPPRLRAPFDLLMCMGLGLLVGWWSERRRTGGRARAGAEAASPSVSPQP